jgi:hypothetical protein
MWREVTRELVRIAVVDCDHPHVGSQSSALSASFPCMLKAEGWPLSPEAPVWQAEARRLGSQATRQLTPAMRQQIDLREIYADALAARPTSIEGQPPQPVTARWRRLSTKTPITH